MKCKQQQRGRLAAAEELVSRLRNYKNWKVDLQEALIRPGSGLKDLGKKLSSKSKKQKVIRNKGYELLKEVSSYYKLHMTLYKMLENFLMVRIFKLLET